MELCDHHHKLILEHFHPSQKKPHVHVQPLPQKTIMKLSIEGFH